MNYKLVAMDMDGTLLNSKNEISYNNKLCIKKANELGINIVLCTGRIFTSALYFAKYLDIITPIISCNGAYISEYSKSNVLYENPMSIDCCERVIDIAEKEDIYYHFYDDKTFYAREMNKTVLNYYAWNQKKSEKDKININIMDDPFKVLHNKTPKVYKFVIVEDNKYKLSKFRNSLSQIKGIEVSSSWWNNVEVMNKGVSKGKALKELCKVLKINSKNVIAIGDNENDISMLEFAGLGVAMGNSEEKVKKLADEVTDINDNDGVGKIIDKYIL